MRIKTRRYHIYYWLKGFIFLSAIFPLSALYFAAEIGGRAAYYVLAKYRKIALSNLNSAFGGNKESNGLIAKKVFVNLAKNGVEWIKLTLYPKNVIEKIVRKVHGMENLDQALSGGKGAIVLTFHFGNWELVNMALRNKGYKGAIIVRKLYFHKYDKIIVNLRKSSGADVIYRDASPKKMLRILRNGNVLGMLADQDIDNVDGVFVKLFGKDTFTPTAPVRIAGAAGVKIVPVFDVRQKDNSHEVFIEKPIDASSSSASSEDLFRFTEMWTNVFESYIKKYPDQWVWVHERWKTAKDSKKVKISV